MVAAVEPSTEKLEDEYVRVTSKLSRVTHDVRSIVPRSLVNSRVPLVPAERSTQPVAVAFADTPDIERFTFPLTVSHQSLELFNVQPVGVLTLPLPMVMVTPDRVKTDAMVTVPTWFSEALLTLSTVPFVPATEKIEKHRLPLTVTPSPPRLPDVMHNWGEVVVDVASVMVPPRPVPPRVPPRNDSSPPLKVMLVDGSHVPEVAASVTERALRKPNWGDEKVRVVEPEAPSPHKVVKMAEHDVDVWGTTAELEGPADPPPAAVPGADASPLCSAGALPTLGVTFTETGPETAKSPRSAGT
ncbi:MAG TPA: hypothetical protein VFN59_00910 [Acidimicrobiales bacterium]|nr:hypothetical protein [Acidimicrobiales bacterium]